MKLLTKIIFIGLIAFSFIGCTKVEGLGGRAMIKAAELRAGGEVKGAGGLEYGHGNRGMETCFAL